jgi:hypothetical protein
MGKSTINDHFSIAMFVYWWVLIKQRPFYSPTIFLAKDAQKRGILTRQKTGEGCVQEVGIEHDRTSKMLEYRKKPKTI